MKLSVRLSQRVLAATALGTLAIVAPATAQSAAQGRGDAPPASTTRSTPRLLLPPASTTPARPMAYATESEPVVQEIPTDHFEVAPEWSRADAQTLLAYIRGIEGEGLFSRDYEPVTLDGAINSGDAAMLNETATRLFTWVAQDLRDGRTEMDSRKQWFVVDPDAERLPIKPLLEDALASGDIEGALDSLKPVHPDYLALRDMLAVTPKADSKKRARIMANMDRWRWLARDLGRSYLLTNVPEYQLRLTVNDKIVRSYKTVVGKPGRTATPQLAEVVEGVIFNPTWTVPQSIVVGEGLGARLLNNPARAAAQGYKAWKTEQGMTMVVQQPGPNNSLGLMKLDMPNEHAIFLHDTPAKHFFEQDKRALSHGCIRTERALELAMTLAIAVGGLDKEEALAISSSGEYTKVPLNKKLPVYITYFTMARDIDGQMRSFDDLYGRDAPVLASMAAPRVMKTGRRVTNEPVIPIAEPGV